jgi:uncharacterized membrane protein YkvA (DUF1232 family)
MDQEIHDFLRAVPAEARDTVNELLRQPRLGIDALRRQVREHTADYLEAARERDLDTRLAQQIERRCIALLESIRSKGVPAWQRRIVQAAVEYYVFPEDGDGDFDSVSGLDDDAEVINAALFVLGQDDDTIEIA